MYIGRNHEHDNKQSVIIWNEESFKQKEEKAGWTTKGEEGKKARNGEKCEVCVFVCEENFLLLLSRSEKTWVFKPCNATYQVCENRGGFECVHTHTQHTQFP